MYMCYLMYIPVYCTAVVDNYESTVLDVADLAAFEGWTSAAAVIRCRDRPSHRVHRTAPNSLTTSLVGPV